MLKSIRSALLALALAFSVIMVQVSPVRSAGTDLTLTKTIEGGVTTAQVGGIIRYRIHFACSNLTTPCGPMEITDVLQPGLTYIPAQSSVPAGFTMTEAPAGTITITKDDNNLLDGSQYDAVIAVQVNYDLRDLPQTINNTITGRIAPTGLPNWENTTPASAPPITVGVANPYWAVTKALSSPIIEPTVDTDVTYQIDLCPTTPPPGEGNVALNNITIVDTLPAGAAFVSASNSGIYAPGPGTVTWSVAGPVYPPNCVTRFVTIRYNSPSGTPPGPFSVGNNVTNTVDFDADYVPSTGTCTSPCTGSGGNINHNIDPIAEVPNYNKDDVGDPIGLTGTGRFILNLDTNNTNYPSNNLILVDNLPPQLRVLSVTSGGWSAAFQHVRAHVEYSTNNGSNYIAFAGSPALYNTNATYAAPAANITNVRWRFEYDPDGLAPYAYTQPGLPYTWSFTSSPEIRITPRATPPAAVAGNTYTNCLQVTRTDSGGAPVTDTCNNESMTVQGNLVSLRVSKNETPGGPWNDIDDPTILSFISDTKILPGDTVRYTITLELTERSSEDLVNPTIQDTLPGDGAPPIGPDFVFVRNGTATLDGGAVVQPTFTQVGQVLKWEWPSLTVTPLPLGSRYLTVEFYGYVPRGQDPDIYTNNLYAVTDSTEVLCEIGSQLADSGDVDTDGNISEFGCRNPDLYVVERSAALRGEKWIRSISPDNNEVVLASTFLPDASSCPNGGTNGLTNIPTNPFTRYPCIAQAFPEGALSPNQFAPPPTDTTIDDFEYNLRIFNDGNVPMLEYVLYDILPRVGDTGSGGVLANTSRASEFRPSLTGPIQFIQGPGGLTSTDFTIEYNTTINPCRPEVFDQPVGATVPGGCDDTWVLAGGVADWTLVRSYRIRLNNDGSLPSPSIANAVPAGSELRFGAPMQIPSDAPPTGFDTDDALSREIAWNSFSHVGSYDKNSGAPVVIEDLLASEPRKVGITVPERMSVGNRVWRDADNSGTINAPDDTTPGIANVLVNLYRDVNNDGIPDGPAIGSITTDAEGYYLFSNIPYDSGNMNNNRYIIGIPASNFDIVGDPLYQLRSSTGTPAAATYTAPTSNIVDSADDGIDPVTPGQEVFSWAFTLQPGTEPTVEADLSNNNRDGLPGQRRGVNGERDNNSDLTLDFGFFGGSDVPFSIGNHVWKDNGAGGGVINDGIRQAGEPPVIGALVRLYRDGNANGIPEAVEMIRTDITDADGFYLFDNLDPGPYYVEIAASNFQTGGPLVGWYSSQVTGSENVGVPLNTNTPNMDSDDNGIDAAFPEFTGVFSGSIMLTRGINEQTGESHLSNDSSSAPGFNPTAGDGPGHIGRFGEIDTTSNVTVDFGFIPPMSLGNRVWFDEGAGTTPFRAGYDNGLQDGTEAGVSGVTVQLWRDTNGTPGLQTATDTLMDTDTTDATGYYLFERLQPGNNYFVRIPTSNFTGGGALVNYLSSTDANQATPPTDNAEDTDDNGVDNASPATNGINSTVIAMSYNGEPLTVPTPGGTETDIPPNTPANVIAYGANMRGLLEQEDDDSNLTIDFGFVRTSRSLGNRVWYDLNNDGQINAGDDWDTGTAGDQPGIPGVRVSLYQDSDGNGQPDDINALGNNTDDWLAWDTTDATGYYLFDKLPPGRYIVGVDYTNFAVAGLLEGYASSKSYVDNFTNNTDNRDNGMDRLQMGNPALSPYGILSTSINLTATPVNAPTGETGSGDTGVAAGFNPTAGDGPNSRGRFGETDANSDLTIDFGFFIPMSLGNRVFIDDGAGGGIHNNGIMDGAELPRANVRVELYRDANTDGVPDAGLVDFDITDTNGFYLFDDLASGSYVVVIPFGNFAASFDPDGGGPLPSAAGALLGYNTSTPTGMENVGVAGNPYTPNTDRDDNGLNVGTAPTTGGVRSGTITLTLTTEATGETELSGQVDPGSPANLAFNPTGWDGPLSRGRWGETDANSNLTVDLGFIPVYALGNRVFFDTNNNSLRNGAEVGIDNVRVQLFASDGLTEIPVGPDGILYTADDANGGMLTAGGGYYRFNNLPAGDYIVRIPASNFGAGQPLLGTWSSATTISNAGVSSETPAPDVDTTVTDSDDNGTLTSGNVDSLPVTLGPLSAPPEPIGETDLSGGQGQPDAQANMTVDFGFYTITLGNLVWVDNGAGGGTANDGVRNGTEPGIDGVTVQLWSQDLSTMLASTTTAGGGVYTFAGLTQGNYIVRLPAANFNPGGALEDYRSSTGAVPPSTYEPAPNPDATTVDSDDNGTETGGILGTGGYVQTSAFALTPAGEQLVDNATGLTTENRVDFGFAEFVALGNRVWFDTGAGAFFNNGILDAGETPVNNVTVQLYTSSTGVEVPVGPDGILGTSDDALGGVQTSGGGYYHFDQLYPETYYVQIPATEFQAGGDLFGYVSSSGAGANETGDNDADENGVDVPTLTTTGIRTQDYALLSNTEQTGEDQSNYTGLLDDDNVNFTADFGFTQLVGIGNRIWFDVGNGGGVINDGIQNGAEAGVGNVDVELYRVGDTPGVTIPVATTTTDASGNYQFTNLNPGDYFVHIPASEFQAGQPLEGSVSSTGNGSDETSDQDADENGIDTASLATNGISSTLYTLQPNTETATDDETSYTGYLDDANVNFTADFGFLQKVAIGNVVWLDNGAGGGTVNDGIQNGSEPGIPSVDLQLYLVGNTPGVDTPVKTTTSGANGYYVFDDLTAGDYFIFIPATEFQTGGTLASYRSSTGNGANETTDQNGDENGIDDVSAAVNGIRSTNYTLQPNSEQTGEAQPNYTGALDDDNVNFTADFGFTEAYSIGNRVWFDTDNSGAINGSEVGVPGVTVQLYAADGAGNPTGAVLRTTVTVAGGYYLFDDLYGGDYVVILPASNFTGAGALTGYWSSGTTISSAGLISETLAPDADLNVDSDDNGTLQTGGAFAGAVIAQNVVLGPTGNTEPTSEGDLQPVVGQGNQPDAHANLTVDFGFYRVELGNLVFADFDSNGTFNGADTPLFNVQVRLYSADGTTEIPVGLDGILGTADDNIGSMFTNISGAYLFSNLPEGNYIVSVVTPAGSSSTIDTFDAADNANPNTNTNNNDNGIGVGTGDIFSAAVSLTPGGTGAQNNNTVTNLTGTTSNLTVDFGFVVTTYSLGNRVWFDTTNNSLIDSGEVGVNGVLVELYAADLTGNPISPALASDTTTNGGYYLFDNLVAGDYVVVISASNFASGGVLNGYWSSATTMDLAGAISEIAAPDPDLGPDNALGGGDDDRDSDDNGTHQTAGTFSNAILSLPVTLGPGNIEPAGESDLESGVGQGTAPDLRGNMTVDFGFYRVGVGNLVFVDVNANGTYDAGDTTIPGATVQLFSSNGTEINVGPDGILNTGDDAPGGMTTSASGTYTFTGLAQGDYIVVATPVVGFTSTVDTADAADTTNANTNTDHNDNGIGVGIGQVTSSVVTLTPGDTGTSSNNTVNNGNGTTSNPTLDFGFVGNNGALTKRLIDTNESFTTGTDVAIGEIVTYEVSINLPLGTPLTNVTVTDTMDKGLAFVDCLLVEVAGVDQTGTVCPPAVSAIIDPSDSSSNPANPGRQVVFAVGDIPAQATATSLVVRYRAVVLDVIENQTGVALNNSAAWAWTGGSFTTSAEDVEIVEPDLTIDKAADPVSNVAMGTPVQFTLTIAHTAQSTTDAFDVVVTDLLPPTLEYVPCTIVYSGLAPSSPAAPAYCPGATTDLTFRWDSFPMGSTATITFHARLLGSPSTNSASVAWTSLPIDPGLDGLPIILSDHNVESTERWYDPLDDVNIYAVTDDVVINNDGGLGGGGDDDSEDSEAVLPTVLPATGFAPNVVTQLPAQPAEKAYKTMDVWVEIPRLGVKLPIVGVPLAEGEWDVSWLWKEAGWLDGTAFPGWQGNSVLTSHVTLPDGNAGPFANLAKLKWGDRIIIHAYGVAYVYEVRQNRTISPYNATVLQHEEDAWLTLLTCKSYNEDTGVYSNRVAVRAVLASVKEDTTGYGSNNIR